MNFILLENGSLININHIVSVVPLDIMEEALNEDQAKRGLKRVMDEGFKSAVFISMASEPVMIKESALSFVDRIRQIASSSYLFRS